jgi:hypothetical protein
MTRRGRQAGQPRRLTAREMAAAVDRGPQAGASPVGGPTRRAGSASSTPSAAGAMFGRARFSVATNRAIRADARTWRRARSPTIPVGRAGSSSTASGQGNPGLRRRAMRRPAPEPGRLPGAGDPGGMSRSPRATMGEPRWSRIGDMVGELEGLYRRHGIVRTRRALASATDTPSQLPWFGLSGRRDSSSRATWRTCMVLDGDPLAVDLARCESPR